MFFGRERELADLTAAMRETIAGRGGRLFLISGEPGIGKTRLADELAEHARADGTTVLWGRCWEGGGAPAFWPWVQILRAHIAAVDPRKLREQLGPSASDVVQLVPEIINTLPNVPAPQASEQFDPEGARFRLFDATTSFLKAAAATRPLVLILDDLHAADTPSLVLLRFLAREIKTAPIFVCGTYREPETRRSAETGKAFVDLVREAQRIALSGLAKDEVEELIRSVAGVEPSNPLLSELYSLTEGNPFFVAEVLRLLISEGHIAETAASMAWKLAIPQSVRDVIARRLDHLPEECRAVLTVAAVAGREFDLRLLERVSTLTPDQLMDSLEEAIAAHVLVGLPGTPTIYRFAHALIRESLYDDLRAVRRVRLHGQIGEALEDLHRPDLAPHLAELAHHFLQSAPSGDLTKAVDYARQAGESADAAYAYEEAARHFSIAIEALERYGGDEHARCELLLALASAQDRAGEQAAAKPTFRRAADLARKIARPELLARAALGSEGGLESFAYPGRVEDEIPLLREALGALPSADSALRARVLSRLAVALHWSSGESGEEVGKEAIAMAERVGDPAALATALSARRYSGFSSPGDLEERLSLATRIIALAEQAGDRERMLQAHRWRLMDFLELGDIVGFDREVRSHDELARELRQPAYLVDAAMFRSLRALLDGRFEEVEPLMHDAQLRAQEAWQTAAFVHAQMFWLNIEQGRHDRLSEMVPVIAEIAEAFPIARCGLARIFFEMGQIDQAHSQFEQLFSAGLAQFPRDTTWIPGVVHLVPVCAEIGDAERAGVLFEMLRPWNGRNVVAGPPPVVFFGPAAYFLGLLAKAMGRADEAAGFFEEALVMCVAMGARPFAARIRHAYGALLSQAGNRDRGLDMLGEALTTADELGMTGLAARVRQTQQELGSPLPAAQRIREDQTPSGQAALRLEGEYWTLAYRGQAMRFKDAKGFRYLARLLAHPGKEFPVDDLAAEVEGRGGALIEGHAGPALDPQAKAAYRRRLEDLQEELDEAEANNDPGRSERARAEIAMLTDQLAAASGLGGRDRRAGSAIERERVRVTKAIRTAVARISRADPGLGRHLAGCVRTGFFCTYAPDPERPLSWDIAG